MRIVVLDGYTLNPGDMSWGELDKFGDLTVYDRTAPQDVVKRAADAEIILTNKVVIGKEQLEQLPHLRYVGVLATGYNVVDCDEARRRNVVVTNIPAYSTDSVAQMTFAHILNITNRVGHYATCNTEGRWNGQPDFCYWDTPLHELSGKTLGIIGLGNIGMKVARIARDFGMDVFAQTSKDPASLPAGIQKTTFHGLLGVSDVLSLHCPLTQQTKGIINMENILKMKRSAIIINTGRGPLVNEEDMAEALSKGYIAGYGADVLEEEPPRHDSPLLHAPNAFITPHIAWATTEARQRLMEIAVKNVASFLDNTPENVVN